MGQEIWVTRDYGGEGKALSLHKSVLGVFVHELRAVVALSAGNALI